MTVRKHGLGLALCAILCLGLMGCDALVLPGALAKLANNALGELTADEIRVLSQIIADNLNAQNPGSAIVFNQEQSQAIADFLDQNGINTFGQLEALFNNPDPNSIVGLEELAAAFQGTNQDFDPDSVSEQDLEEIFNFTQQSG